MSDPTANAPRGRVFLVGAGPGDPGLITVRGLDVIRRADVVVYDYLANPRLLDEAPVQAERVYVGKQAGAHTFSQDEINRLLIDRAAAGRTVVRLKGGDPFVFGRGGEEAEALAAAGIGYEVVPGVTAGIAAAATAGIPATHREIASAVALVTGHEDGSKPESRLDWEALARFPGTLVFYMAARRVAALAAALLAAGKPADTPAAVVQWGTLPAQRTVSGTLADLGERARRAGIEPPAITVVGAVAALRPGLRWFEDRPLFGQRIVLTRPPGQADRTARALEDLGAEVLSLPAVRIEPPADWGPVDRAIDRLAEYGWLAFTSANGVRYFLGRLFERRRDLRAVGHLRLAAIGPGTAEALGEFHLRPDCLPTEHRSEGLLAALRDQVRGRAVLLPRADRGRELLRDGLIAAGARVDQIVAYRNLDAPDADPEVLGRIRQGSVDWITLTSSAIARSLGALLGGAAEGLDRRVRLASISPVTTAAAAACGWRVAAEAAVYTTEGLIEAIVRATRSETPRPRREGMDDG